MAQPPKGTRSTVTTTPNSTTSTTSTVAAPPPTSAGEPRGDARNVLFITVDQWRGDSLSGIGHPLVETPTLDALAADGVLFRSHFANIAPCAPSRASLYTGLYAHNHRVIANGTPLDDRHDNIARMARRAGYVPTLFGYTDTAVDPRTVPAQDPRLFNYEGVLDGFHVEVNDPEILGMTRWAAWLRSRGIEVPANPKDLYLPRADFEGAAQHGATWAPTRFPKDCTETAFMVGEFIDWIDRRSGADPFFVHLSIIRPHPPYRNPEGYHDLYSADDIEPFRGFDSREDEMAFHPLNAVAISLDGVGAPADERDRRQLRATYHAMQREVDDQLGRLIAHLKSRGLYDSTLIVVTSDHGEMGGDHHLTEKLGYWDESFHVPLIVRDPRPAADATRGTSVSAFTESIDVVPTILDWIGLDIPDAVDGRSLTPFLHDGETPDGWRDAVFWEWHFADPALRMAETIFGISAEECCLAVVRTAQYKLVRFGAADGLFPPLLFDLAEDPDHRRNLHDDPARLGQRIDGLERLVRWRMLHADRTLSTYSVHAERGLTHAVDPRR